MRWNAERVRDTIKPVMMLLIPLTLATCGSREAAISDVATPIRVLPALPAPSQPGADDLRGRLVILDRVIKRWREAPTLHIGHEAAEEARNLIVGAPGPFYGDANGDGKIGGATAVGVLPGLKGEAGLAGPNSNACVVADVLGGSWSEPVMRWSQLQSAIARWTAARNTFPSLPSHAQRVVGWASLALKSDSLADARAYAGHARIHVDVAVLALTSCRR